MFNTAVWLSQVKESGQRDFQVDWRPFSLAQVNQGQGADFKHWEQPGALDGSDNTLLAHRAGLAAKRQGGPAFERFLLALLKARHQERRDLTDPDVMTRAAAAADLDLAQFLEDLADPALLRQIGDSHTLAVEKYGVFGVPTLLFPGGEAAFLKMFVPPAAEAAQVFDGVVALIGGMKHVGEIKRPQPPWPTGVR
ncbi:MAG: hypothetical protein FJ316_10370 [SAR202 cluster bacterium]|nr:hypothetical protein [SAR202 cluster bacterium]